LIRDFINCEYKAYLRFHSIIGADNNDWTNLEAKLLRIMKAEYFKTHTKESSNSFEELTIYLASHDEKAIYKPQFESSEHLLTLDFIEKKLFPPKLFLPVSNFFSKKK